MPTEILYENIKTISWPEDFDPISLAFNNCADCKLPLTRSSSNSIFSTDEFYLGVEICVCKNCRAKSYTECVVCGHQEKKTLLYKGNCQRCINNAPKRLIRNYSYKIELPWLGKPENDMYMGVEIELESDKNFYGQSIIDLHPLISGYAEMKRDSSISMGAEIVTTPASRQIHKERWAEICAKLPKTVFADKTCGMHVHVSRNTTWGVTDFQIGKVLSFLHNPQNRKEISFIAGRESSYHNDFAKPKCLRDGRNGGFSQKDMDRHTAFNCNNVQTLEFRIFASTTNYSVIAKNLDFCEALMCFAAAYDYKISECTTFTCFMDFVSKNRKEYRDLHKFLLSHPHFSQYVELLKKTRVS